MEVWGLRCVLGINICDSRREVDLGIGNVELFGRFDIFWWEVRGKCCLFRGF